MHTPYLHMHFRKFQSASFRISLIAILMLVCTVCYNISRQSPQNAIKLQSCNRIPSNRQTNWINKSVRNWIDVDFRYQMCIAYMWVSISVCIYALDWCVCSGNCTIEMQIMHTSGFSKLAPWEIVNLISEYSIYTCILR